MKTYMTERLEAVLREIKSSRKALKRYEVHPFIELSESSVSSKNKSPNSA